MEGNEWGFSVVVPSVTIQCWLDREFIGRNSPRNDCRNLYSPCDFAPLALTVHGYYLMLILQLIGGVNGDANSVWPIIIDFN